MRATAGCSSPLTTTWRPRAARAAPRTPRALASVPPPVNTISARLGAERRRDLAARRLEGARGRRAQAVRRGWVREEGVLHGARRREHLGRGPGRCGVVEVNHPRAL